MIEARPPLSFRSVNRRGTPQYDAGLNRHHLIPRQVARRRCFARFAAELGNTCFSLDDFRANGLLLPVTEEAVLRTALPLHRGPHPIYSEMVGERLGKIESLWAMRRSASTDAAAHEALAALGLLRSQLRLELLDRRRPIRLNRHDPLGVEQDFGVLDLMAETLWKATG